MGVKRRRRWAAAAAGGLLALLTGGCATYSSGFQATEAALMRHRPDEALQTLRDNKPRDRVLYLLNKAMLLRMTGQYGASNQAFEDAKRLDGGLRAVSLREQSESFIVNDATRSYVSEEY